MTQEVGGVQEGRGQVSDHDSPVKVVLNLRPKQGGCWGLLGVVGGCWGLLGVVGGCWGLLGVVGGGVTAIRTATCRGI